MTDNFCFLALHGVKFRTLCRRTGVLHRHRNGKRERGALTVCGGHLNVTAVPLNDSLAGRQPKTDAASRLRPTLAKRLEDPLEVSRLNANSIVFHEEL